MIDLDLFLEFLKENKLPGATQEAIGDAIGKTQSYVSQINNGRRPFRPIYTEALKKRYGDDILSRYEDWAINKNRNSSIENQEITISELWEIIKSQQRTIENLSKKIAAQVDKSALNADVKKYLEL